MTPEARVRATRTGRPGAAATGRALVAAAALATAAGPAWADTQSNAPPDPAAEAIAAGDAHYARRAEGARGGVAQPFHAEGAILEYRRALALDPESLDARLRLLRAYFFRGGFCGPMEPYEERRLFDEAKRIADETVKHLEAGLKRGKGRLEAGAARAGGSAAEAYVWAAVSWGQWAVFHKIDAAWTGAPARIRDLAQAVISIDPSTAQGAGYLILGRLHAEAPRIPFVTAWVSRPQGVASLRRGVAVAPENPALRFFLGDALLRLEPSRKDEARALLQGVAALVPRPDYAVEDAHYAEEARDRLASLR